MKRLLLLTLFLAGLHYAAAQDVRLTMNRLDGIYSKGDTVRVYGRCADVAEVNLTMEIKVGGITRETGTIHLSDEFSEIYTEICDSTKWVAVLVHTADDKVIDIGYIVNPEDIRPGYKTPWDLRCYWKREVAKMRRSEMTVKVDTVEAYKDYIGKVICWHVELSMHDGFPVNAYVSIPVGARAGSLPIRIQAHGATDITEVRTQSKKKDACFYASQGLIGVDINAHGMQDGAPEEYYKNLDDGPLKDYAKRLPESRDSWYFRLMYLRLVRLVDYLVTLPQWDGMNIMVGGHSQGGGQALALGGIDPRITHVYADEPALCDHGGILQGRIGGWPFSKRNQEVPAERLSKRILPYFDGALLAGMFHGKLYIRAGLADYTCPPTAVFAVYNNAGTNDKTITAFRSRHHTNVVWYDKDEFSSQGAGFPAVEWLSGDSTEDSYSVVILGDTHYDAADTTLYHAGYTDPNPSREAAHREEFVRNGNMWADRCPRLARRAAGLVGKDTRFVFQVGDLIQGDTADSTTHVRFLDDAVNLLKADVAPNLPFVTVIGNHDFRGNDDAIGTRAYKAYMTGRMSRELGQDITSTNFIFHQGPDVFVALNYRSSLEKVKALLEQARGARHVFVLIHTPVFPFDDPEIYHWYFLGKRDDSRADERREMRALLASLNAIVLCGHTHATEFLDWEGDGGRITQMTMSSVWADEGQATYKVEASGPDGYPHYAPVFDEYRPGIRDYSLSWAAGSYKLIISGPRVYVDFYAGDSKLLSKRFILR